MKMNTKSLIIVADIESFIKKNAQERASHHEAFLLGLYDEHDFSIVNLKEEKKDMISIMINFVEKHRDKETQVYIYFHNLSSFDGLFILKELTQFNYNYQKIIRDGKIYELALKMKDYRILIRDSFLLYPKSLKKAAEDFNDKYFKDDYPLKELHLDYVQKHEKELKAYLKKDLQCLYEFLMHYNNYLLKTFNYSITSNLTLTSLSHKLYLQHYYQGTMPKITKRQDIFLRQSYKGGIVDIYKPQGKNLVHLDVNAMYPFIMKNHSFGDSSLIFLSKLENIAPNLYEFTKSHRSFIRVIVICKELYRPLITIKWHEKNVQPEGCFETVLYSEEIKYCLEHYPEHYTFKFVEAYYYSEVKAIFKDYIDDLYEKRQNYEKGGKNHLAYVIKYMLNSIYGRFAIKNDTKETHIIEKDKLEDFLNNYPAELVLTQNYKEYSQIISTVPEPSRDLFYKIFKPRVDLASAITALARIHMHELMKKVTVYYTDTDSIVIEEKDLHKLEDYIGPKLGQLKIVNHWDEAIFIAPKVYVAFSENNYHFVAKSIKKESLDGKDFFKILKDRLKKDSEQNFQIIIPSQMTKSLRDQRIYQYYDLQKNYYFKYDKRKKVYKDDLWVDTLPLNIYRNYII